MLALLARLLALFQIDPRGFLALTRVLILMDLRAQYYAAATASKPEQRISPLFLVVGQCLTMSTLCSLFLFARVDVWFFTFVNLSLSLVVLATTILVEFQEVVLDPHDLQLLGHQPITPRTYAAARFANLLFYFVLVYLGLHLFPMIVGAGLRDAGLLYIPAYFAASLASSLVVMSLVILILSVGGVSGQVEGLRPLLAWTQIILIMVVFYGGQLILRDGTQALLLWGAFPPPWIDYVPTTWLAHFVARAAQGSGAVWGLPLLALLGVGAGSLLLTVARVAWLYRRMHPTPRMRQVRPMPPEQVGGLGHVRGSWLVRGPGERIGYWMCLAMLRRDPDLLMRSLLSFALAVTAVLVGVLSDQFANPCATREASRIGLPILSVYLIALAVPTLIHNLTFCRDSAGSWLWWTSPLEEPAALARGACKAVGLWVITPCCLLLGVAAGLAWGDPLAALLHAGLAWVLAWLAALASLWLIVPALPFSRKPLRGGSLGLPPLPLFAIGSVATLLGTLHLLFADQPAFWIGAALVLLPAGVVVRRRAERHLTRLARPS
jgi:hypothetical protein